MDFIKLVKTSSVAGLRRSSKAKPAPKKGHGHCLVVCCPPDPLQPSESQQNHYIWEVCSALMRCTKNCNACSWHWSTERARFFTTMPNCTLHKQRFKCWTNWTMKVCLTLHIHLNSHQLTMTSSSTSTTFCRENASTTSRRQKMLSKSSSNHEPQIFTLQK